MLVILPYTTCKQCSTNQLIYFQSLSKLGSTLVVRYIQGLILQRYWRMCMLNWGHMRLMLLRVCCRIILCSSDTCYTPHPVLSKGHKWLTSKRVQCKWHLQVERLVGDSCFMAHIHGRKVTHPSLFVPLDAVIISVFSYFLLIPLYMLVSSQPCKLACMI